MFSVYLLALRRVQNLNEENNFFPLCKKMKLKHLEYDEGPRQSGQSLNKNQTKSPKTPACSAINELYIFFPNGRVLLYLLKPSSPELHLTPWPTFIMAGQ